MYIYRLTTRAILCQATGTSYIISPAGRACVHGNEWILHNASRTVSSCYPLRMRHIPQTLDHLQCALLFESAPSSRKTSCRYLSRSFRAAALLSKQSSKLRASTWCSDLFQAAVLVADVLTCAAEGTVMRCFYHLLCHDALGLGEFLVLLHVHFSPLFEQLQQRS